MTKVTKELESQALVATTSFDSFKSMEDMLSFGEKIAASGMSPLKTGKAVVAAMLMGKELGLGVMAAVNNIHPIEGRSAAGIHIITGLALKAGITYKVVRDYEPVFQMAVINEDEKGNKTPLVIGECFLGDILQEGINRGKKIIDYKTVVEFTRLIKRPDGTYKEMIVRTSFSWGDAVNANLHNKSNWKYPKIMCMNRALAAGFRMIGDDVILGLYETSELADSFNIPTQVAPEGTVTIIQTKEQKQTNNKETTNEDLETSVASEVVQEPLTEVK